MRFLLGGVVVVVILVIVGVGFALLGFFPTNANSTPPQFEQQIAMAALDASMERRAPRLNNPIPPTDENLIDGLKIYTTNCAVCHGGLDRQPSVLGKSLYPPAPNVILNQMDDPEWHVFYAVRTGVRYTGMASWEKVLSEPDMWKVTAFLTRIDKLSPAVQDFWKKSAGVAAPTEGEAGHEHHDHANHK
jgi:mono/diheme cytochrome c family protein